MRFGVPDNWLGVWGDLTSNANGDAYLVARLQTVMMFARAQNARVRVTLGGVNPNSNGCYIRSVSTCFDANNCALPPP